MYQPQSPAISSFKRKLLRLALLGLGTCLALLVVLASPAGRVIDRQVSMHFAHVNQRREQHQLTWLDGAECYLLYHGIALAGRVVSPEAGAIVAHYLDGDGQDLWLDSSYLRTSPVVQRSWRSLRVGQSRRFSLRQAEDWHLSYALNPFHLRREAHRVLLWQWLEFSHVGHVKTVLNYGLGRIELPDALIHALHPTPFMVYATWQI